MNSSFRNAALAAIFSLVAAAPAFAQTATGDLTVSANVTKNCVVSAAPMAFGDIDVTTGSALDGTAQLTVRCTSGTEWTATADAGLGTGATFNVRKMKDGGTNFLNYGLYTDTGRTTIWGDGDVSGAVVGTGSGSDQLSTIYGRIFGSQASLPSGEYQDTVQVTVSYL